MAVVALMLLSSSLAVVPSPAQGIVVDTVEGFDLPQGWNFTGPGEAGFALSLPAEGHVESAEVRLEGSMFQDTVRFEQGPQDWMGMPVTDRTGFEVTNDSLEVTAHHRSISVAGPDLGKYDEAMDVDVNDAVTLGRTSPDFSGSRGGTWRYYRELEVSMHSGTAVLNAVAYIGLDIPKGHCGSINELRIGDGQGNEAPLQVIGLESDPSDNSVVNVELIFPVKIPASGTVSYRLYYGNPMAVDPNYSPMLLADERWPYRDTGDSRFTSRWKQLSWTGDATAGSGTAEFKDHAKMGKSFAQVITVNPSSTYSQIWDATDRKFSDFQLQVSMSEMSVFAVGVAPTGLYGYDFRVAGDSCYRLVYSSTGRVALYRVRTTRHLEDARIITNDWELLGEHTVSLSGNEVHQFVIRADGSEITIFVNDLSAHVLRVMDTNIRDGFIGTFLGGLRGPFGTTTPGWVSNYFGHMTIWSTDVTLTGTSPSVVPSEEREGHFMYGRYTSQVLELEGARDTVLDMDLITPEGTGFRVYLLDSGGTQLMNLTNGEPIPEGLLDGGFKLQVEMWTERDWVTPKLVGWGVGYTASVYPGGSAPSGGQDHVRFGDRSITLEPSRDLWFKQTDPVMEPGNIDEDRDAVLIDHVVRYGGVWHVYYTGWGTRGRQVCMATSPDLINFYDHRPVFQGNELTGGWDSHTAHASIIKFQDMWYMFYIGYQGDEGQVGLAISGDGRNWGRHPQPVLKPSANTGFDDRSIDSVCAILRESDGTIHLYYTGRTYDPNNQTAIGLATSTDGLAWQRSNRNPVLKPSAPGGWDDWSVADPWLVGDGKGLVMYYRGSRGDLSITKPPAIGYALSDNWLVFKKSTTNPVLAPQVGGLTDDALGVTGFAVVEDEWNRHRLLYSALSARDYKLRAFVADSGFHEDGSYTSLPLNVGSWPRRLGSLVADHVVGPYTEVRFFVRTSDDTTIWSDWLEAHPGEMPEGLKPLSYIQLKVELSSPFGDSTPIVRSMSQMWHSNVRNSRFSIFPAITFEVPRTDMDPEVVGTNLSELNKYLSVNGVDWVRFYEGTFTLPEPSMKFGYMLEVNASPDLDLHLELLAFDLHYRSPPPNGIRLDVGGDGTSDWVHHGGLEGVVTADITDGLNAYLGNLSWDLAENITVPVKLTTESAGRVVIIEVTIVVNTPVRIVAWTPAADEVWIDEGDALPFNVEVEDLDGNNLSFEWSVDSGPVFEEGAAFEYIPPTEPAWSETETVEVSVVVSDGHFTDKHTWTVHVNETGITPNIGPLITSWIPVVDPPDLREDKSQTFSITANDPDSGPSPIVISWYINGTLEAEGAGTSFDFNADYDSAGTYEIIVVVSDGEDSVERMWNLTVIDVARPGGPPGGGDGDGGISDVLPFILLAIIVILGLGGAALVIARRKEEAIPGIEGAGLEAADAPIEVPMEGPPEVAAPPAEAAPSTGATPRPSVAAQSTPKAAAAGAAAATPIVGLPLADMEKDRTFVVEELYLIYNDGRLICHQSREERSSVDTDLFGGMFTAIQQFIHDSMGGSAEAKRQVGRLDYGENRILVERGNYLFLAVIIFGEEQDALREAMRDILNRIEGAYAGVIERWSGDQTQLSGVGDFIGPLVGLTADLSRETIVTRTVAVGVKMLSEIEFFQGYVRLKIAVRNDTKSVITNVATDISYDPSVLRVDRIQPEYEMTGTKVFLATVSPREKKTVAYYLDPLICQESDVDGTTTYKDAEGKFKTVTMKRRRADIVCPIFFTEENANTAMLKRLIKEELGESDSKIFNIPKILSASDAFTLIKEVVRTHDIRFVREFVEEEPSFHGEAWYFGVTKVKKDKMVIRASVWDDKRTVEFFVASGRLEAITGLLAEFGQQLNRTLKERFLGRVSATPVIDEVTREEVKGLGLLIDKYSEGEVEAGEVDQV